MAFYSKFAQYYDSIFPFKQPLFDFLQRYTSAETKNILDAGCGTGHYAAAFSHAGFHTIGIDLDGAMIDYAQKHYPEATFHVMNMLNIESLEQQFELIFCIGNTLAHLQKDELHRFLHSVRNCLTDTGYWIFQVRNWEYVLAQQSYEFPLLTANKSSVQFTRTYTDITSDSLHFNTRMTENDKLIFQDSVRLTPFTSRQYIDIHQNHHFRLVDQFGDFERTPFRASVDSANILIFQKLR